jgi:glycosyltransferase involved in cell wall biosynthesis
MRIGLRNFDIPRVFQVAGPLHLEHYFTRKLDLWTANKKDYWIPTCKWVYDTYKKNGVSEKRMILSRYRGERTSREYIKGLLRKELGLTDTDIIVGMVAYMYAPKKYLGQKRGIKGHEDFIDAIKLLSEKYENLYGVCIGGAWNGAVEYEQQIRKYAAKKCDKVFLLGTRTNVPDLYQDFNVAVHPSHSENIGGAGESLFLGIPTVATNIGGFPDVVIDGVTGYLANPKDPVSLAKAIDKMLSNPEKAKEMSQKGRELICKQSIESTTKQIADFYKFILGESV